MPHAQPPESAAVTLRARFGRPLDDETTCRTVVAAARGIAERTGVRILDLEAGADAVTVLLATSRLGAIGFAAELRRTTQAWFAARHSGAELWSPGPEAGS